MPFNCLTSLPNFVSFYLLVQDFNFAYPSTRGRDSVVGMATGYGLNVSGFEIRWRGDFPHAFIPAHGPTQPRVQRYRFFFPEVKRLGVALNAHPTQRLGKRKSTAIDLSLRALYGMLVDELCLLHVNTLTVCCYRKTNRSPVQEGEYPEKWEMCNK